MNYVLKYFLFQVTVEDQLNSGSQTVRSALKTFQTIILIKHHVSHSFLSLHEKFSWIKVLNVLSNVVKKKKKKKRSKLNTLGSFNWSLSIWCLAEARDSYASWLKIDVDKHNPLKWFQSGQIHYAFYVRYFHINTHEKMLKVHI